MAKTLSAAIDRFDRDRMTEMEGNSLCSDMFFFLTD
jgi:hypothetical protein